MRRIETSQRQKAKGKMEALQEQEAMEHAQEQETMENAREQEMMEDPREQEVKNSERSGGTAGYQDKSLEEVLGEVEAIIQRMQRRDISLEESFGLYQEGMEGLKVCNEKIDAVEKKLILLNEEPEE